MLPLEDNTMISLNWPLKLSPSHLGFLGPLNQQAKERVTALVGVIDPDHQGLLLHNGSKGEHSWNTGDPLKRPKYYHAL